MSPESPLTLSRVSHWDTDELLILLSDPFRRQIIRALAGGPKPASEVSHGRKNRHSYHKHFTSLRKAGIIIRKDNTEDPRKPLYYLDPRIVLGRTDGVLTVNFGRSMMRVRL